MSVAKLRHLLLVGAGVLALFAFKAYQQPDHTASGPAAKADATVPAQRHSAAGSAAGGAGFDYYVLSLSWSPEYCATEARPGDSQCQRPYAFVVPGLWPQNERGYPENCGEGAYLDQKLIQRLLPIMPSRSLIIHEWKKHGACTGLAADAYFSLLTKAYNRIKVPAKYQALSDHLSTDVATLEGDFMADNPGLKAEMLSVQCRGQYLQELRVCLSPDLAPRACGSDVRDRCGRQVVLRPNR